MNDKRLRTIYALLLGMVVFTIIAGAASAYFPFSSSSGESGESPVNTITVTGTGTVSMPPDEAIVYLGVQTTSEDVAAAQRSNAEKMDKIIKALQDAGIDEDDMETSGYSIYPQNEYYYGMYPPVKGMPEDGITGYVVSNQLKVTVKDIDSVGDLIDAAVDAGANQVNSVGFTLSEPSQQNARKQALKNAVKAARDDADDLAGALDVKIIGSLQATTAGGSYLSPMPFPAPYMDYVSVESARTPIEPGDVSVTAYVTVTYQFE